MLRTILIAAICATTGSASATDFFHNRGDHALNAVFGLPAALTDDAFAPTDGFDVAMSHVNIFAGGVASNEYLLMDGERTEIIFTGSRRLNDCWYLSANVPLVAFDGGVFDRSIEFWHELFSLPDGDRQESQRNQLIIEYNDPVGHSFRLDRSETGIGDISLELIRPLACATMSNSPEQAAIRFGVKLPSGDQSRLMGSGAFDGYMDFRSSSVEFGNGSFRAGAGILVTGQVAHFRNQEPVVLFGKLVTGYRYSGSIDLKAQLDMHTPMFNSELKELGDTSVQLIIGGTIRLKGRRRLELAIMEDLTPDTSPDIGLYIRYRRTH